MFYAKYVSMFMMLIHENTDESSSIDSFGQLNFAHSTCFTL